MRMFPTSGFDGSRLVRLSLVLLVLTLGVTLTPTEAGAQSDAYRLVLLNVPGGGTDKLTEGLKGIAGVEVMDQDWFIQEVKSRGITPRKILRRPKDLRWVIEGAEIDYIMYLKQDGDEKYIANYIGKEGTVDKEVPVDRTSDGLTESGVKIIVDETRTLLGAVQPETKAAVATVDEEPAEETLSPNEVLAKQKAEQDARAERLSRDWLFASLSGRFLKRDLSLSGANGAVLNYHSQFYPGFSAEVEAYPFGSDPDAAGAGVYADFLMGFASVKAPVQDPNTIEDVSISHIEVEGGPTYRLVSPIGQEGGATMIKARVKVALRYASFGAEANRSLPSTSMISVVVGAAVSYPVFTPGFAIQGEFEVVPLGFWGTSQSLFGESSSTYGFGSGIGGIYAFSPSLGLKFGYKFRLDRTAFSGNGELDFVDTEAFELVQGAHLGVFYQY